MNMKQIKNIISRIRWNVVLGILSAILLILLASLAFIYFKPLESGYKCKKDVCISSRADPSTVGLRDESTIWVDIRNDGPDELKIEVSLETYDPKLTFVRNGNQTIQKEIRIGPDESRKLDFPVRLNAMYGGDYRIDIKVDYAYGRIEDKVTLKVLDKV